MRGSRAGGRPAFAALFALPMAAFIAFDVAVLGRTYQIEYNDAAAGGYNAGLDWLTFYAWPTPHHPAIPFHQATALLVALAGVYPDDLSGFQAGVLATNLLIAFLCGLWAAGPARRLELTLLDALVLGILVVTMPAVLAYASQWSPYGWLAPFMAALAIVLFEVWLAEQNTRARVWSAALGLGFAAGFYFPVLGIAIAAATAVAARVALSSREEVERWLGFASPPPAGLRAFTYVAIWVAGASLGTLQVCFALFPQMPPYDYNWGDLGTSFLVALAIAAVPTLVLFIAEPHLGRWGRLIPGIAGPALAGWLIAANVLAPYWPYSAHGALVGRTGLYAIDFVPVFLLRLSEHHWNVLIGLSLVALAAIGTAAGLRGDRRVLLLVLVALASVGLNLGTALRTFLEIAPHWDDPGLLGQAPRVLISILLPVVLAYLLSRRSGSPWPGRVAMGAVLAFGAASLWQHVGVLGPAAASVRKTVDAVNALSDRHLRGGGEPRLLCARSRIPRECALAYAFNHSRYPRARAMLPPPQLKGGAVCYSLAASADCGGAERLWREAGCAPRKGPILISQELPAPFTSPAGTVYEGYFYGMRMNLARCPPAPANGD